MLFLFYKPMVEGSKGNSKVDGRQMQKYFTRLTCFLVSYFITLQLHAQKYEAENATLTGGATKQNCASCSGGYFVAQGEGRLAFNIRLSEAGFYTVAIRASAPHGNKTNIIAINEITSDFLLTQNNQYETQKIVHNLKLGAGHHTIEIRKSWGWINIDFIEVQKVDASERFHLNQALVTPDPTPEAKALYDFLLDNYGRKIISGVMTLHSMDEINWLKENTGKEPALLGIDFMHSGRSYSWYNNKEPIQDALTWYNRNGIPALMWHWRDPSRRTEEFYTKSASKPNGTDFDISKITDESSAEYQAMLGDIDYVAGLLKELQEQHVPVIWRPLHEAAGGWFWWGAKGAEPCRLLFRLMYDRMTNYHGLHNLIWVWTREPGDEAWYPGDEYVDIVGRDIYKGGDHSSHVIEYNNMNALYGGKKMIALSEAGSFPDPDNLLRDGAGWSWYMPWYGDYTRDSRYNSLELWRKTLTHGYVITLDEMPHLKTYQKQGPTSFRDARDKTWIVYPTIVSKELVVEGKKSIEAVVVYSAAGAKIKDQKVKGNKVVISLAGVKSGLYLVKIHGRQAVKVIKE